MKKLKPTSTMLIFLAMILGMIAGYFLKDFMINFKFVGDIFLRLIQMSVVVLILGSVIESIGSLQLNDFKRIALKSIIYFTLTTTFAALCGVLLANILQPGVGINFTSELTSTVTTNDQSLVTIITNFFPNNIVSSLADGNTIQVIIFALLFGIALSKVISKSNNTILLDNIKMFNSVLINIIEMIMKIAPLGVFSLLGWVIANYGFTIIIPLMKFLLVLALGTLILLTIFIIYVSFHAKVNPIKLVKNVSTMAIVAFTTTSSAVTLPTKMEDSENKLGVSKKISNLINPLGMSLNSDGLALYLSLSCLTIAQFFGIEMTLQHQLTVVIMAILSTLGTVVVPGGGLVALTIVLPTVGLPIEGVALLAGIDWFSGMFRTVLNVVDDALISLIIAVDENEFDKSIFNASDTISLELINDK